MQGIVTEENGDYVKAAIAAVFRETEASGETEEAAVTYIETDEKGRFLIQDLNPDDKYRIEIYVKKPDPEEMSEGIPKEAGSADQLGAAKETEPLPTIDSRTNQSSSYSIPGNKLYDMSDQSEKYYLKKTNLW